MTIPFAIEDLIICDDENWRSRFLDGFGLASAAPVMAPRYGRRPLLAGVDLPAAERSLQTLWLTNDHALRKAWRTLLKQKLNPGRRVSRRFTAVNAAFPGVAPDQVLLWLDGDMYYDTDASKWKIRDMLRPSSIEAEISGAVHFEDGAIVVEAATTNFGTNPSFEESVPGGSAGTTSSRDSTEYKFGQHSCKVVCNVAGPVSAGITHPDAATNVAAGTEYAAYVWVKAPHASVGKTCRINLCEDGGVVGTACSTGSVVLSADWQRIDVTHEIAEVDRTQIYCQTYIVDALSGDSVYIDGHQLEERRVATSFCIGSQSHCAWSSTPHASTSTRVATAVTVANPLIAAEGTLAMKWTPRADEAGGVNRYLFAEGNVTAYFMSNTDKIYLSDGTNTIITEALTWDAEDTLDLVFVWSSVGMAIYIDGVSVAAGATYTVPVLGATLWLGSTVAGSWQCGGELAEIIALSTALTATQVKALYDNGLSAARWRQFFCRAADAWQVRGTPSDKGMVATLISDGDVRWRRRAGDHFGVTMTAATAALAVTNRGDVDAYPVLHITPRTAKSTGYAYKRFIPRRWRASSSYTRYPDDICDNAFDTATLVTASKMQADGDDLRVLVDGEEAYRWLDGINTSTTKMWVNLDFEANVEMTLKTAIGIGDTVTTVEVNESITAMPSTGILLINSEVFTYTSKNDSGKQFLSVTRAAKGTSAANHGASSDVYWLQHDIWIIYGNSTAGAPYVNDNYKPAFELDHSTNVSWVYETFGEDDGLRAGQWVYTSADEFYGGNQGATADPWIEMGIQIIQSSISPHVYVSNPCGITNANFTNGEKYAISIAADMWSGYIESGTDTNPNSWVTEYSIPTPGADVTWEAWSRNEALASGSTCVAMVLTGFNSAKIEFADCTISLNSSNTPIGSIGSEQGNYSLELTVENEETGDEMILTLSMDIDEKLIVDTNAKTVTYLGENQIQARTLTGGPRLNWLPLSPGESKLNFSDTGTEELDIEVIFDRRLFE